VTVIKIKNVFDEIKKEERLTAALINFLTKWQIILNKKQQVRLNTLEIRR